MKPFAAEMIDALNKKVQAALITVGHELNRQTDKWTPVWRGYLQRSKRVEVKGSDVYVVAGDSKTKDYVLPQYYKPLRHRGDFQSGLQSLTALYRDGASVRGGSSRRVVTNTPKRPSQKRGAGQRRARVQPVGVKSATKKTGMGEKYLYSTAYRLALKNNQLNKLDAPMWYDRAVKDAALMDELKEIFVRRL